ncbi:hypothetical protein SLA2020_220630 [Shorea laevis]
MAAGSRLFLSLFLQLLSLLFLFNPTNAQGLKVGFYEKTCPKVELIVKNVAADTMSKAPSLAGALLRMFFHDCFVRGCDGSILLDSPTNQSEKDAFPNLSLRGYQIIDRAKAAIEKECPGVVSCSDILALIARDVVAARNGPSWEVETGRRDGNVSIITDAFQNLPGPGFNISQLITRFQQKGLSVKDLAVLSAGHTLGVSHCFSFSNRLYNFTGKGINNDADPTLDPNYVAKLKVKCKPADNTTIVEMDPGSFSTFDNDYYKLVTKRRGLFQSDAALLDNAETKAYVELHATQKESFFQDFGVSMLKMGRIGVLTGTQGEIRKVCSKVN